MLARSEFTVIQRSKVNFTKTKIEIIQSHKLGASQEVFRSGGGGWDYKKADMRSATPEIIMST